MADKIGWHHPVDESDQWDGFNEPGIETFAGSPIRNFAREVCQNSLDASESGIVNMKIRLLEVETAEIPNIDELKTNLESCYQASKKETRKAEVFFKTALDELSKEKMNLQKKTYWKQLNF